MRESHVCVRHAQSDIAWLAHAVSRPAGAHECATGTRSLLSSCGDAPRRDVQPGERAPHAKKHRYLHRQPRHQQGDCRKKQVAHEHALHNDIQPHYYLRAPSAMAGARTAASGRFTAPAPAPAIPGTGLHGQRSAAGTCATDRDRVSANDQVPPARWHTHRRHDPRRVSAASAPRSLVAHRALRLVAHPLWFDVQERQVVSGSRRSCDAQLTSAAVNQSANTTTRVVRSVAP